ncbi:MAG: two pore domain potassium channel family protein [Leptolyngbya sp. SIO1D8]|nr:two pore domain potassium channel family protein [Leptolyngbya sp. SIO1D8]
MNLLHASGSQKYRQLLIVLIILFLLSPFLKAGVGSVVSDLLLLYSIILIIRSLTFPKSLLLIYLAIAGLAFCLQLNIGLGWTPAFNQAFDLLFQIIFALYIGGAAYLISHDILTTPRVTADTVQGGISVYLLIGFAWALFYGMVATLDPNAFSQPLLLQESYLRALHFSFTTLTTLGYGDIVPVSEVALVLTNLEAILGQMYPAVFISVLVGGYLGHRAS